MKRLSYKDIHTHNRSLELTGDAVVSIRPDEKMLLGGTYSVGIHPWDTENPISLGILKKLVAKSQDSRVVAIGECGFDALRGGDMDIQEKLFIFHARLARQVGKPLIIHSVRSDHRLLQMSKHLKPEAGEWIIHGFRGKPESAKALLKAGFDISIGEKFNPESVTIIPPERLYHETD